MAAKASALGEYLRARRQQVRPEDVGLVPGARRRVQGLRREELALLAGISVEYYLRLEVGRDKNPSAQVVEALARALRLDYKSTRYLHQLANPVISRWDRSILDAVVEGLDDLIDQLPFPAIVASRYQDVLAANPMAQALSPGFALGQNFLRWRLLDPAARELYVDWEEATDAAVSGLRELAGTLPDDPRMHTLIAELSSASPLFRQLWARANVGYRLGTMHLRHPLVGDLYLCRNQLNVPHLPQAVGQHLLVYRAEPGSDSARALEELRSLSSPAR
ncbi:MAG: helix-turn-helix domain-containing protein [Mycobacterium sp.]|uniref:helix-turn-helix domain-containing protein n=1 Tax=Mycobacterium sp. TaxID=1785 RepID=UPI001EB457A2|nr:helix-turn-helix domain-containing protein [Mycobacterium sp.]MBW0019957.1 helix-turn-helix domain-containing protein [Mycobacterium sp.]